MSKHLLLFFGLLVSVLGFSQEYYSISGSVKDSDNNPIAFANVILLVNEGSEPHMGVTTNDLGEFEINGIASGSYLLQITFLGYEAFSKEALISKNITLGNIVLKENLQELDGVTVMATRPTVKRLVDRLVFNVENSTLSNTNALDVLKHTPGVIVNDNKITVKQTTPTVYINDRRVHLSINEIQQLLEGTSATNIKSIEVITNPPAKYEAEGGSVLNIVTNKNLVAGYNGSLFGNYKQGKEFPKYTFGTSHFFKTKKLNTYLNYSISPRKDYRNNDEYVNFIENEQIVTSWETDYKRIREKANQNINVNIDYEFNDNNSLAFSTSMLLAPRENSKTFAYSNTNVFDANKVLDSSFLTTNRIVDETFNFAFTLDYLHKFKTEGEKLMISAHHTNYDFSNFQNVDTDYLFPDESLIRTNRFQTFTSKEIKLYTGQADYVLPIKNSGLFEAGLKYSNISSENILTQYAFENDVRFEDFENSDTFLYDEANYAFYASFAKDWETWSLKLGLRTELTEVKGNSISSGIVNKNNYTKFFPSVYISHQLDEKNEVYFNYNKRIYRPRYGQLNPFKYFLNDNVYVTGDPNLKPQVDDSFILGYTLNKKYTLEAFYRYENNPAIEILFQDNDENILKYINTNIDKSLSYGLDFTTYTAIVKRWSIYVLSSLFYYDNYFYAAESGNKLESNSKWSFYGRIDNYFSFLKDHSLTAELSYYYISSIADGPSTISDLSSLDFNLRKVLWNNRASISAGITDMFNSQYVTQTNRYLNQDVTINSRLENRLFTLGFNYKFGNFNLKNTQKNIELKERERLREKN
ncbi:TonB-dependent receptor [Flavobacteriaceae bacterium GSB9]|nr:TonB-dependent receptor [Flavobacteriaceae bacterium GSB9]